jgi:moderate conductance mechanosensitive channel
VDILLIVAEVGVLIVAFSLLNALIGIIFRRISGSLLKRRPNALVVQRQNISLILLLTCVGLCLLVVGVNGALVYQGKSVQAFQLNLLRSIPSPFWTSLATAIAKSLGLLILVKLSLPYLHRFLDWSSLFTQNYDRITANNESIEAFFNDLKRVLTHSVWLLAGIFCLQFLQVPDVVAQYLYVALKAYVAIAVGRLMVQTITVLVNTLDALALQMSGPDNLLRHYQRFRHLIPVLKKCLEYILYVGITALIISEISFIAWIATYADKIVAIIAIYFFCGVLIEFCNVVLEDLVLSTDHLTDLQRQRRLTIIPLFKNFLKYATYFTAALIILKLFNIDPAPLLAGAGLLGIVVGFGAQNLINDIVCGFFILFENYYLVGDYIEAGKVQDRPIEGIVEAIELRTTQVRHPDGQLQIVRNGEMASIINYSKQYTYAKVEVPVPHHANLDRVYRLIEEVGVQLKADCLDVLEATQIEGLENFGGDNLVLRTLTKVKPGKHLEIQRLLRKRLKYAFDRGEMDLSPRLKS